MNIAAGEGPKSVPMLKPTMLERRSGACAAVIDNRIYIFGGMNDRGSLKKAEVFDAASTSFTSFDFSFEVYHVERQQRDAIVHERSRDLFFHHQEFAEGVERLLIESLGARLVELGETESSHRGGVEFLENNGRQQLRKTFLDDGCAMLQSSLRRMRKELEVSEGHGRWHVSDAEQRLRHLLAQFQLRAKCTVSAGDLRAIEEKQRLALAEIELDTRCQVVSAENMRDRIADGTAELAKEESRRRELLALNAVRNMKIVAATELEARLCLLEIIQPDMMARQPHPPLVLPTVETDELETAAQQQQNKSSNRTNDPTYWARMNELRAARYARDVALHVRNESEDLIRREAKLRDDLLAAARADRARLDRLCDSEIAAAAAAQAHRAMHERLTTSREVEDRAVLAVNEAAAFSAIRSTALTEAREAKLKENNRVVMEEKAAARDQVLQTISSKLLASREDEEVARRRVSEESNDAWRCLVSEDESRRSALAAAAAERQSADHKRLIAVRRMLLQSMEDMENSARQFWEQAERDERILLIGSAQASKLDAAGRERQSAAATKFHQLADHIHRDEVTRRSEMEQDFLRDMFTMGTELLAVMAEHGWRQIVSSESSEVMGMEADELRARSLTMGLGIEHCWLAETTALWRAEETERCRTLSVASFRKQHAQLVQREVIRRTTIQDGEDASFRSLLDDESNKIQPLLASNTSTQLRHHQQMQGAAYWDRMKEIRAARYDRDLTLHVRNESEDLIRREAKLRDDLLAAARADRARLDRLCDSEIAAAAAAQAHRAMHERLTTSREVEDRAVLAVNEAAAFSAIRSTALTEAREAKLKENNRVVMEEKAAARDQVLQTISSKLLASREDEEVARRRVSEESNDAWRCLVSEDESRRSALAAAAAERQSADHKRLIAVRRMLLQSMEDMENSARQFWEQAERDERILLIGSAQASKLDAAGRERQSAAATKFHQLADHIHRDEVTRRSEMEQDFLRDMFTMGTELLAVMAEHGWRQIVSSESSEVMGMEADELRARSLTMGLGIEHCWLAETTALWRAEETERCRTLSVASFRKQHAQLVQREVIRRTTIQDGEDASFRSLLDDESNKIQPLLASNTSTQLRHHQQMQGAAYWDRMKEIRSARHDHDSHLTLIKEKEKLRVAELNARDVILATLRIEWKLLLRYAAESEELAMQADNRRRHRLADLVRDEQTERRAACEEEVKMWSLIAKDSSMDWLFATRCAATRRQMEDEERQAKLDAAIEAFRFSLEQVVKAETDDRARWINMSCEEAALLASLYVAELQAAADASVKRDHAARTKAKTMFKTLVNSIAEMEQNARTFWEQGEADDRRSLVEESTLGVKAVRERLDASGRQNALQRRLATLIENEAATRVALVASFMERQCFTASACLLTVVHAFASQCITAMITLHASAIVEESNIFYAAAASARQDVMRQLGVAAVADRLQIGRELSTRLDFEKRAAYVFEHESNRRFVINDDRDKELSAMREQHMRDKKQLEQQQSLISRKGPQASTTWERMRAIREQRQAIDGTMFLQQEFISLKENESNRRSVIIQTCKQELLDMWKGKEFDRHDVAHRVQLRLHAMRCCITDEEQGRRALADSQSQLWDVDVVQPFLFGRGTVLDVEATRLSVHTEHSRSQAKQAREAAAQARASLLEQETIGRSNLAASALHAVVNNVVPLERSERDEIERRAAERKRVDGFRRRMLLSLEDMEDSARAFWRQGESDDWAQIEQEESASSNDARLAEHSMLLRNSSERTSRLVLVEASRRGELSTAESVAFANLARDMLFALVASHIAAARTSCSISCIRTMLAEVCERAVLDRTNILCEVRESLSHISSRERRGREDINQRALTAVEVSLRSARVAEHEDNRRFVLMEDECASFNRIAGAFAESSDAVHKAQLRRERGLGGGSTREYWDRMKELRESARDAAAQVAQRKAADINIERARQDEDRRERLAHTVRIEHGGRKLWTDDEASERSELLQNEISQRSVLWARLREEMYRRHMDEQRAVLRGEEEERGGLAHIEDLEWRHYGPMAVTNAHEAMMRFEGRLRKAIARAELLTRLHIIQREADQADILQHIWPEVLALWQGQETEREDIEREQAADFETIHGSFIVELIDVPFRSGARRALERIHEYCAEHYPQR